jgi:hypothetical protein
MVKPMEFSTRGFLFIKSVHDGFQSNSESQNRNVWTSTNGFWIAMLTKVTPSWKKSVREMKHESTLRSWRVNASVWSGNIFIFPSRKSSKRIQPQEKLCLQFVSGGVGVGCTRTADGTLSREWFKSDHWILQLLAKGRVVHDNARLHTVETLKKVNSELLEHPPYSPDLSPAD